MLSEVVLNDDGTEVSDDLVGQFNDAGLEHWQTDLERMDTDHIDIDAELLIPHSASRHLLHSCQCDPRPPISSRNLSVPESLQASNTGRSATKFFLAGACCAALLCVVFVNFCDDSVGGEAGVTRQDVQVHQVIAYDADYASGSGASNELPQCSGVGDAHWRRIVTGDLRVPTALNMSFRLASLKRLKCNPPLAPLEWDPEMFIDMKVHDHEVVVMHRFSSDCRGESFLMHFRIAGNPETKFDIEIHHNRGTDLWTLLETDPGPCWLLAGAGTSAAPRMVSPDSVEVRNAAMFAIGEISFRARQMNCLNTKEHTLALLRDWLKEDLKLRRIQAATAFVIKKGLKYQIYAHLLHFEYQHAVTLHVIQRCPGTGTQCFYQLELPDANLCDPRSFLRENDTFAMAGVLNEDRTNNFVSQKVLLSQQKLDVLAREPLQERYIFEGDVPPKHDLREDNCLTEVAVYEEGECNAGYASAWAGMMGARQCIEDTKHGRLQEFAENAHSQSAKERRLFIEEDINLPVCVDDDNWSVFGESNKNCKHFARHGCSGIDYGQFTHCRFACDSCPKIQSDTHQWAAANYNYMPSVEDLASCSMQSDGQPTGCTGGNMWSMWDNNLAKAKRPLWISGSKCKPNTLKCWHQQKIVNPLNRGLCPYYKKYPLWHRPCSCIEDEIKPKELPQCDTTAPPDTCGFAVPPAAFVVRGVSSGLSFEEACLNYQRHILESGPLYVSVTVSKTFMSWNWKKHPVYTGGGGIAGGTAMMILGWGGGGDSDLPHKFWILRNNWGTNWADKGSCLWLRGENLYGIENQAGVIMASQFYRDWSAPICRLTSWRRRWEIQGQILINYTLQIKVQCSEDCSVRVLFSNKVTAGQAYTAGQTNGYKAGWNVGGIFHHFQIKKHEEVIAPLVPLHLRGYGLKDADMWLVLEATDQSFNSGETTNIFTIPSIPGATQIQEHQLTEVTTSTITTTTDYTPTKEYAYKTYEEAARLAEDEIQAQNRAKVAAEEAKVAAEDATTLNSSKVTGVAVKAMGVIVANWIQHRIAKAMEPSEAALAAEGTEAQIQAEKETNSTMSSDSREKMMDKVRLVWRKFVDKINGTEKNPTKCMIYPKLCKNS